MLSVLGLLLLLFASIGSVAMAGDPSTGTISPTVIITSPSSVTVPPGSTVIIVASAIDNVEVAKVVFSVDGKAVATDTAPPYTYTWKVPARRTHQLQVEAFDAAGNRAVSPTLTVTSQ